MGGREGMKCKWGWEELKVKLKKKGWLLSQAITKNYVRPGARVGE